MFKYPKSSNIVIVSPSATRTALPWIVCAFKARHDTSIDSMGANRIGIVYQIERRLEITKKVSYQDRLLPFRQYVGLRRNSRVNSITEDHQLHLATCANRATYGKQFPRVHPCVPHLHTQRRGYRTEYGTEYGTEQYATRREIIDKSRIRNWKFTQKGAPQANALPGCATVRNRKTAQLIPSPMAEVNSQDENITSACPPVCPPAPIDFSDDRW